jgi:hypothetical protein
MLGRGTERRLARIVAKLSSQGQLRGKCRVLLPPEVVMRPGRFKSRVRMVLVVMGTACAIAAWMTLNAIAHNLGRGVNQIGLGATSVPLSTRSVLFFCLRAQSATPSLRAEGEQGTTGRDLG